MSGWKSFLHLYFIVRVLSIEFVFVYSNKNVFESKLLQNVNPQMYDCHEVINLKINILSCQLTILLIHNFLLSSASDLESVAPERETTQISSQK